VTLATKLPATFEAHDRFDVPEPPEMVFEDNVQERPGELVVTLRVTVPVNPFSEPTVMVERPGLPVVALTLVGFAVKPKSGVAITWKVTPVI
jgi:hypothetical protein